MDLELDIIERMRFGSYGNEPAKFLQPFAICSLQDRIIVTDDYDNRIHVFSRDGLHLNEFYLPYVTEVEPLTYKRDICIVNGDIWISSGLGIRVFDSNYKPIRLISVDGNPRGICCTPKGLILVSTGRKEILTLSQDGCLKQKFSPYEGKVDPLNHSWPIACNSRNEILILNYRYNRIDVFSESGLFLRSIGSVIDYCLNQYRFHNCRIYTDWEDNTLVTDYHGNRITIFDHRGNRIQTISINIPCGLCLTGTSLFVTSGYCTIYIFSNKILSFF